jgi:hypothetical protein
LRLAYLNKGVKASSLHPRVDSNEEFSFSTGNVHRRATSRNCCIGASLASSETTRTAIRTVRISVRSQPPLRFSITCACSRCARPFELTISESLEADVFCPGCGGVVIRRIPGYLYVLSNPEMPGLLKIGQTTRSVPDRLAELNSATGVPSPFVVQAWFESTDPQSHEAEVHNRLAASRLPSREFFRITISEAINVARAVTGVSPGGVTASPDTYSTTPRKPSIFRKWQCGKCSREFKSVTGNCCDQQAKLLGPWEY